MDQPTLDTVKECIGSEKWRQNKRLVHSMVLSWSDRPSHTRIVVAGQDDMDMLQDTDDNILLRQLHQRYREQLGVDVTVTTAEAAAIHPRPSGLARIVRDSR
jgi:hypothetical protein